MKANIDAATGILHVLPETEDEADQLSRWEESSMRFTPNPAGGPSLRLHAKFLVHAYWPLDAPRDENGDLLPPS